MDGGVRPVRLSIACLLIGSVMTACSTGDPAPTPTVAPTTTTATPTPTTTDARDLDVNELVVPAAAGAMPDAWQERFVIGYGKGKELLGTAPGGDSGSLDIGPDYGAPGPDGSWWFLDAAKARLAHYDSAGQFLDRVRIPRKMLVSGQYFQWQLPHVLADGTLVAARQTPEGTSLLRLRDGVLDEIRVDGMFAPTYDDGVRLYGFSGGVKLVVVDPADGSLKPTAVLDTPSGRSFSIKVSGRGLLIHLPDAGVSKLLPVSTASGASAHVGVQVRAGADDTLHLFLVGSGADDESVQLVGATLVSPSGRVAEVEGLSNPFSEADPGSPAQLAMAPGSSTPMLVYVLPDGVHVYERVG
ncbi:MAG: hypothetical protein QOD98_4286 [Nocardioidaceae bacterium]|nr:hypothetical protein [Nocardioidaceae bacterium]